MSEKLEAIVPGSTWVSKETGLSVEIVSVKDGAVWWESEEIGFRGAQQTVEDAFRATMRPLRMSSQTELPFSSPIKASDFRAPKCCAFQAVASLDHTVFHTDKTTEDRVNRICLKCGAHWYGPPSNVRMYTRAEWDELMASAMREDVEIAQPRYAEYCIENGRTPSEQLAHDGKEYPGGKMAGFLAWSSRRNREGAA